MAAEHETSLVPDEETLRLRALAAYGLADTAPEADFDHFARIAAELLGLPVGLVNLVGAERVTVKGRVGIDVSSVPRDVAFCSRTVLDDAVLSVPDLRLDQHFAANPLVTAEGGFRFYAGAPLRSRLGGERIGTLCVLGPDARPALSEREVRVLEGLAALATDRMELRRTERARRDALERFERMAAATPGAVVCADRHGTITHWNPAAGRLFGWSAAEAIGQDLSFIVPEDLRAAHRAGLSRLAAAAEGSFTGRTVELPALRRDNTTFAAQVTLSSWWEDGAPAFGASIHDITARRAAEERLRFLAHHDTLTGCANRACLAEIVERTDAGAEPAAIVLLDLDGFKQVNDAHGHVAGDALLREVGGRLTRALGGRGTMVRLGGDEFAAWLPGCTDPALAENVAAELMAAVRPPVENENRVLRVGCSAGVALAPPGGAGSLMADADLALYRAKNAGRGAQRRFHPAMRTERDARRALEDEVGQAAALGQLELHYQPQVDLRRGGALVGAEALLRWRHPVRGLLSPAAFLAALETGPLARVVGDWVIDEGCRQAAAWHRQGRSLRVGVNLFAEQLGAGGLEGTVRDALARWALPPELLELELTETIALCADETLMRPLRALRRIGVGLAFDDFGTGYASLSTLKNCPLTRLKIDRGFVSSLRTGAPERDREDVAIIEAVLALARGLGLGVVAEGIETEAQAAFLRERGCDEGQGYLFGRPGAAAGMAEAVRPMPLSRSQGPVEEGDALAWTAVA